MGKPISTEQKIGYILFDGADEFPGCAGIVQKSETLVLNSSANNANKGVGKRGFLGAKIRRVRSKQQAGNDSSIRDRIYQAHECVFQYRGNLSVESTLDGFSCLQVKAMPGDYGTKSIKVSYRDLVSISEKGAVIETCALVEGAEIGRIGGDYFGSLNRPDDGQKCIENWDRMHDSLKTPAKATGGASNTDIIAK
jgi:hypothetical protein